jgi:glycosyltransferase involved in cell wall biosynthesis
MAKIAIIHHTLNSTGGGEVLALELIEALLEHKHEVILGTNEPTNWNYVKDRLGFNLKGKIKEVRLLPIRLKAFGIYQRPVSSFIIPLLKIKYKPIIFINTHGDVTPIPTDIIYMHFPTLVLTELAGRIYSKYYSSAFWRFYFEPYKLTQKFFKHVLSNRINIITNSKFSRLAVQYAFNKEAKIVYPPVKLDLYKPLQKEKHDKDWVVTIARFSIEKKLEWIPLIAKYVPNANFYIIGAAGKLSSSVIKRIIRNAEKSKVKDRIKILTNLSLKDKLSLMAKAKVYLHCMPFEHFGISIVEAMASGLIPVVHKSGGPWLDIIDKGKYGFGWGLRELELKEIGLTEKELIGEKDFKNAGELIYQSLEKNKSLRETVINRAEEFSHLKFRVKILEVVEHLLKMKSTL